MTIQLVPSVTTKTTANGTSLVMDKPFNTRNDDVILAHIATSSQVVTAPAGWTKFEDSNPGTFRVQQFQKVAGPTEPNTYTFTVTAASPMVGCMSSWHGVDNAGPILTGEHWQIGTLTASEPEVTPALDPSTITAGRVVYMRASRRVDSAPGSPITYTQSTPGVTELADVGVFSGGTVSYSMGLFADDRDFTSAGVHPGLPITATPGTADTHNIVTILALTAAAEDFGPEDFYQRFATDTRATMVAGDEITVIADGEIGDPTTGGGFRVHDDGNFQIDPVERAKYEVLYSMPFEDPVTGRFGWTARIRATATVSSGLGLTCWAVLAQRNPIIGA